MGPGECVSVATEPNFAFKLINGSAGLASRVREMAAEFPHVDFTSVDTVPLVPHARHANILGYEVYDLYNGIAEEDETFDVVHLRHAMTKVCWAPTCSAPFNLSLIVSYPLHLLG
jgi:hypothetical protein